MTPAQRTAQGTWTGTLDRATMDLELDAEAPGVDGDRLQALAEEADAGCAISRALRGDVDIRVRVAQRST